MTSSSPRSHEGTPRWYSSHRFDRRALLLADRHYNRRKIGSPQFVPPGRCVVLLTESADALWTTSWPFAEYVRHAWPGAWVNSLFRNESSAIASELITEAIAVTRSVFGDPPPLGMVTFVNPKCVPGVKRRGVMVYGYSYAKAGFHRAICPTHGESIDTLGPLRDCAACHSETVGGLWAWQLLPAAMPAAVQPLFVLTSDAA